MNNLVISKKKRNLIIAISLSLIIMIIGTTYAYFSWQSTNNPLVDITVEDIADVIIKGGNDINITNIGPVLDYNDGEITEFYIKKKIENNLDLTINIIPTLLPDNLKEESFKLKLLSSNDNITYNEISEINFKDKEQDNIYRLSIIDLNQNITYYKIIFYIDGNMYNPNTMKSNNFKAKIDVSVDTGFCKDTSGANAPVLAEGMIPITYNGNNWVKADPKKWYSYSCKSWANAVMVTADKRGTYMNANNNTVIPEEDILAYYVWIPRYKYKLFNVEFKGATYNDGVCTSNCPSVIDVVFEKGTASTGTTKCTTSEIGVETCTNKSNGNYYTHPAFTFGDTELEGIWIGKFETTGSATLPMVKPNMVSLTNQNVSTQFITSQKFNSTNYLTPNGVNQVDAHLMKNIEWGAVAYLKQSIYGLGLTDVAKNNSTDQITGSSTGDPTVVITRKEGTYKYNEPKIVRELVSGYGTEKTISAPTSDTYIWNNIGTSENPIWKSSNQKQRNSSTTLTYTFELNSEGAVTFDYSVSCAHVDNDYLYYIINKEDSVIDNTGITTKIGGTSYGTADASMIYESRVHALDPGTYTLEFTYSKTASIDVGADSAYVKNVRVLEGGKVKTSYFMEQGGPAASTTGNITGIYDMSGGVYEYVMGVMQDNNTSSRSPMSGAGTWGNSGYMGTVGRDYDESGNTMTFPISKYYDLYANGSSDDDQVAYDRAHLGDATGETRTWYKSVATFIQYYEPWFRRGGSFDNYMDGINFFSFARNSGDAVKYYGFRTVLSVTK